ncbi:condensin complex subunit 2 [Nylanderia fulva]|uniref:condensin complex subunit 2 n=1 Tax=Nylanderia fulva TaxID=613905 RepID=UPI0010FB9929|nr:condensin complex subunit 2 [Nylanderia fulva]
MSIMNKSHSVIQQNSTTSSPLRRKSVAFQNTPSVLSENDDEAERIARRREIPTSSPLAIANSNTRRHSLGLGFLANIPAPQMAESITQCIKLSAENKINIKNAFSLAMIDFMTYMVKKQDSNMSNLQVASTSLDVSTKIYGFRVDSVHTQILKIVGGLDKQAIDDKERNEEEYEKDVENADINALEKRKKKKKKARQKIFSTVEALKSNIEITKPILMMIGEGDLQTTDMLYQATLPHHANSGFYQHLYKDVLVDVLEDKSESQIGAKDNTPLIDDFSNLEVCASYSNFEFLGWSMEDEPKEMDLAEEHDQDLNQSNRFQFDLDASVEVDNNPLPEPMNYFDFQQDNDNNHECRQEAINRREENIVDVRDVPIAATNTFEYSFVQPNMNLHWAGPSHWKFRNFAKPSADVAVGTKVVGACKQAPLRKRRQIKLLYDENFDVINTKFASSHTNKLQARTAKTEWNTEDLILPEDVHYDVAQMIKLYLIPKLSLKPSNDGKQDGVNAVAAVDLLDNERYDYDNPNDTLEYCPDANTDANDYDDGDDGRNNCNFEDDATALATQNFIGNNLVAAPKLANKISIEYCLKAKKIDMRQLKKSIWRICTDNVEPTNVNEMENAEMKMKESKKFSNVYKALPKLLTKSNVEALSVPISFISLLHLANEKTLKLISSPDLSDITVEGG